ncbi:hypothetical protein [Streptomyces sp. NPDC060188]|uniref:hypothetical protein n=1 Tax=Streptomyces sp. NPDC060188 TaxID=3347068 RepID=UPI0036519108
MRAYLFGSALREASSPNDLDVLIVYQIGSLSGVHALADRLRKIDTLPLVEVIALNEEEECETNFIESVGAKEFWRD